MDQTGNTRFWVIAVSQILFDEYNAIDKDQLWAQVLYLFEAGESYFLTQSEMLALERRNEYHRERTTEEILLLEKYDWEAAPDSWGWSNVTEIAKELGIEMTRNSLAMKKLKKALLKYCEYKKDGQKRTPVYMVPPGSHLRYSSVRSNTDSDDWDFLN